MGQAQALHDPVDGAGEDLEVAGLDRREHGDPELVAAELAIGLGVHDPVGAQRLGDRRGVDGRVQVDRGDGVAPLSRIADERDGVVAGLRPAVHDRGGLVAALGRPVEPALPVEPLELVHQQEQGRQRGCVPGLAGAGALQRDRQAERVGDPAARRGDRRRALDRRGRQHRDPQPAVGGEALLRGEVVGVEGGWVHRQPAGPRGGVDGDQPGGALGAPHRHGDARGGLVVGERVQVDVGVGARLRVAARRAGDDLWVGQVRGAGDGRRELGRELAEGQVLAAPLDQREDRHVPEHARAAVAERDLVAVGEGEQLPQPRLEPADHRARPRPAVAGAEVGRRGLGERGDRLGSYLGRPGAEPPVGWAQVLGKRNRVQAPLDLCQYQTAFVHVGGARSPHASDVNIVPSFLSSVQEAASFMSSPIEPAPGRHGPGAGQSRPRISRRVGAIAESATLAIDAKAKALKASGEDVIAFGAGEPDFPTPSHIVEAAAAATRQPRFHHYTPTAGLPELREAVAVKTARDSGYRVEPGQVLITNGGKQAIYNAFATLLDPGDEVLVPAPYWVTYPEAVALAGGVPVIVPTDASTGFRAGVERLEAARTPRTKVLLFVSPSNPTGAVYPRD